MREILHNLQNRIQKAKQNVEGISQAMKVSNPQSTACMCVLSRFSRVRLCDPVDHSPPGSSVRGILQAGILECMVVPSSKGSSPPRDQTQVSCLLHWQVGSLPLVPLGSLRVELK